MAINAKKSKSIAYQKLSNTQPEDYQDMNSLEIGGTEYRTLYNAKFNKRKPFVTANPRMIFSTIPGVIQKVFVKKGQKVSPGEPLVILEAMKMMNQISSLHGGVIKSIHVKEGDTIPKQYLIAELE